MLIALPLAEAVCLTLITQGLSHGWAVGTALAPDGDVGRIWTLSRPLTYRSIDGLVDKGLVIRRGHTAGRGRDRTVLAATPTGRRRARRWLDTPVAHLRDVRTELLVKLFLRARVGLDNEGLLESQQRVFDPTIDALTSGSTDDLVAVWRGESATAVRRFLERATNPVIPNAPIHTTNGDHVQLSARNQLKATVETVNHGEVMSTVRCLLPDGQRVTAAITKDAAEDLGFAVGDQVIVIIKSTEVMLAKE